MKLFAAPDSATQEALSLADRLWEWLTSSGVTIVIIFAVAMMARLAVGLLINRVLSKMLSSGFKMSAMTNAVVRRQREDEALAQAHHERREQRTHTLSTVAKNVSTVVIAAIAIVMILAELNINIAPIIASLGVAGVAAGIGAQALVKDVVAGIIMLFEDIVAVGDYVDLEYASGTVENVNLRVTQVRALNGVVWTVRNGEIIRIGNYSRGLGTAFVVLDISGGANNDDVSDAIGSVLEGMLAEPEWKRAILGDPEVTGILAMDGARYQRRITADTLPGKKFEVEQEIRARLMLEFSRRGIELALPRFQEAGTK